MAMWFELPNVVDHFPLQNSRSGFFKQGGLMRTLGDTLDPHGSWWDPHEKTFEGTSLGHMMESLLLWFTVLVNIS